MGFLDSVNNLSDVDSISQAIINLGLANSLQDINVQVFDTPGNFEYIPHEKMQKTWMWLQGGGGSSGGSTGAAFQSAAPGAGAGGSFLWIQASREQVGESALGVVATGGTAGASGNFHGTNGGETSITIGEGNPWRALGGNYGSEKTCSASAQISGAAGGVTHALLGTNADLVLTIPGQHGSAGFSNGVNTVVVLGAAGGNSFLGSGGHAANGVGNSWGNNYGGGAGGGVNCTGSNQPGQNGGQGIAIFIEFLSK